MASGTLVEGGGDGSREKNRWIENKVYTRKFHKKGIKNVSQPLSSQTLASEDGNHSSPQQPLIRLDLVSDDSTSLNHREAAAEAVVANNNDVPMENGSVPTPENLVIIKLSSRSKEELRELREKLVNELEQVRNLVKKIEAKELQVNGYSESKELQVNGYSEAKELQVNGYSESKELQVNGYSESKELQVNGYSVVDIGTKELQVNGYSSVGAKVVQVNGYSAVDIGTKEVQVNGYSSVGAKEVQVNGYSEVAIGGGNGGGGGYIHSQLSANDMVDIGVARRMNSKVNSVVNREPPRSLHQLRVSVMDNNHGRMSEYVDKEKRTPKANQYYRNSDYIVGKEKFPPPGSNKKSKINGSKKHGGVRERDYGFGIIKHSSRTFKHCSSLLTKLMKHKHGWVFNTPVDAKGLGLHDYFHIIKHPMDLGTVKTRLNTNWYRSPREFAEDVRLTFWNAMTYNPKGQDVHIMAEQLSNIFEDRWAVMEREYNLDSWFEMYPELSSPFPMMNKAPHIPPPDMRRNLDRVELTPLPVESRMKPVKHGSSGRGTALKKPKAKDLHKREMTYEEKQKLSVHLQNLPSEKLDNIVEIIKRRNSALFQHDDEIEVDIDCVDNETLWELDRFVTNYKKSLSKYKRKAELAIQAREAAARNVQENKQASAMIEEPKETKIDEKNLALPSSPQADNRRDNSSSSSSSSSDSGSSSSDSDSDSSSESDTGHSPRT